MKKGTSIMATFSLADLPSGERSEVEKQIMEHAVAHWREHGGHVKTASNQQSYSEEVHDNPQR